MFIKIRLLRVEVIYFGKGNLVVVVKIRGIG